MIKYNSNTVNEMDYNASPIKKVMYNSSVAYTRKTRTNSYRWVVDGFICDGYDEYQKLVKQVSIDGGESWQNVIPEESMKGELIKTDSRKCGASGGSLPDVAFTVNYNAKEYDASTQTFIKTDGQLADTNVTIIGGTLTHNGDYVTVAGQARGIISGFGTYFNRDSSNPTMTIISKQRTDGTSCHMFANRSSNFNWMYRPYSNYLTLHGGSERGQIAITTQPAIVSARVNSNGYVYYNNYTDGTQSEQYSLGYGNPNGDVALFAGYTNLDTEWFNGDFYWIYMSQTCLTDEQIQDVIDYNENL